MVSRVLGKNIFSGISLTHGWRFKHCTCFNLGFDVQSNWGCCASRAWTSEVQAHRGNTGNVPRRTKFDEAPPKHPNPFDKTCPYGSYKTFEQARHLLQCRSGQYTIKILQFFFANVLVPTWEQKGWYRVLVGLMWLLDASLRVRIGARRVPKSPCSIASFLDHTLMALHRWTRVKVIMFMHTLKTPIFQSKFGTMRSWSIPHFTDWCNCAWAGWFQKRCNSRGPFTNSKMKVLD